MTNKVKDGIPPDQRNLKSLPVYSAVRSMMSHEKSKFQPPLPKTLTELVIPQKFRKFKEKEFLIGKNGIGGKILMFSTAVVLKLMRKEIGSM